MSPPITLYGDRISGNCLKIKWVADYLGVPLRWVQVDVATGGTRAPEILALNPVGKVPFVVFADGRILSESNAVILHLAEGSDLIPADAFTRARMLQWMFWEQYSHEPFIAVRRFHMAFMGRPADSLDPKLLERGNVALGLMERTLADTDFMAGDAVSLADVALVAYTRVAHEGGYDLAAFPSVSAWVARMERTLGIGEREGYAQP
jgi:glutathione S-transferase